MSDSVPHVANGVMFLFYAKSEESAIRAIRKECIKNKIFPVACDDPKNFRFVRAETITAAHLDLIGDAALRVMGEFNSYEKFVKSVRAKLCPGVEG